MLARNATAAARSSSRIIKRYTPRALRARQLATAVQSGCPLEADLVALFDQPSSPSSSPLAPSGLFGQPALASPASFRNLSHATLLRAHLLTERIVRARGNRDEMLKVVKNLDRLSDLLCSVIDLAELVRNAHPDPKWVESANDAYEHMCEYMNVLNTNPGLYDVLKDVLSDPSITKTLSREAYYTALIFWRDFEKSGVSLPPAQRDRFVTLSSRILSLGRQFLHEAQSSRPPALIQPAELEGLKDLAMGSRIRWQSLSTGRDLLVYPGSMQAQMIMRSAPAEEPRRKVYMASNSSSRDQIETLEALLRARGELAQLVGSPSFAHMTLGDKMAKSPENVTQFLETLMDHTRPYARKALRTLSERKQAHLGTAPNPTIQAWDRDYYCPPEPPAPPMRLPPLTLGTVVRALSRLFSHLYGVKLRPAETAPGEVWHPDVRKLEVVDETDGLLGWIYADLFARRGKASGAAHYAVRCSRRVDDDDVEGDLRPEGEYAALELVSREFEERGHRRTRDGVFQLPAVALLTEFARPSVARGPTVLEWQEVLTLYHEMGHAMHSMIGRTDYQNVSGTRCPTDFVELPSILMEHFLTSSTVLSLFGDDAGAASRPAGNHHEDPCRNIDTYGQILLAALDQVYHSPAATARGFDSTAALARLHADRGLIPYVQGTSWQTQFGHLFGYGATYYSYLFDRAIASRVWRRLFAHAPLDREAGERYKSGILRYGGGEDPWKMLGELLEEEKLCCGDEEAMREVGRWKIEEDLTPGRH